jgi:two-component system chemotaxis response regulator CheB
MMDRRRTAANVALLDAQTARARKVQVQLTEDERFGEPTLYPTLNAAFVAIESAPPDIVVITPEFTTQSEFPMFEALLDMLRVQRVFIGLQDGTKRRSADCISGNPSEITETLAQRLRLSPLKPRVHKTPGALAQPFSGEQKLVVIGSSTGGIEALLSILAQYPADCPPTLIVQHIKSNFVSGFVNRLDAACAARVEEAQEGDTVRPGRVLVAPGSDAHLVLRPRGLRCTFLRDGPVSGHRPSIDCLFNSAAHYAPAVVGVILTGMGRDGADGLRRIYDAGGWTIGQDRATSVVYGMPLAASALGAVREELPIDRIGATIIAAARKKVAKV